MDFARRVEVSIYVIALKGDAALIPRSALHGSILHAVYATRTVARESGGRISSRSQRANCRQSTAPSPRSLPTRTELGYIPTRPGGDGAFRRVMVRVPPESNALARTRSGYYAVRTRAEM